MSRDRNQPGKWAEHVVTAEEAGRTVQEILIDTLRVSRRMIQRLTRSDGIRLDRHSTHLQRKVRAGQTVAARVGAAEESTLEPVEMQLDIAYEDADLLVVNKAPFLLVHPVAPHHRATLAHGVTHHFLAQGLHTRVRPVHRLDRDTSGLLLIAKSAYIHQILDRQLRERTIQREYLALVGGEVEPEEGVVDAPIGRSPRDPSLRAVMPRGEPARTRFRVVERYDGATLVELQLETGRTHQIRVHLAHLGYPLLGDVQYGGVMVTGLHRQALHAGRLAFVHPTSGDRVELEAPLPDDLARVRAELLARSR
jgi:RluA family pseudouridine synthase